MPESGAANGQSCPPNILEKRGGEKMDGKREVEKKEGKDVMKDLRHGGTVSEDGGGGGGTTGEGRLRIPNMRL
ncbi:Cyclic dehypoxanthine futalosine synthase [Dissostichus eleginoides]|uniref:Cyclic dehypoxanthine futalosine synthase n=1 Tax=Dissostichus eleginoides TaxID=100907 RepID=A0AAD9B8K1_DISEL|nr:Cyclic dehypoxanthine futalosine synthase [Dissostichus eleginoides]